MSSWLHIIFNSVVVYPTTRKILSSRKKVKSETKRKILAALFLIFIGILTNGYEIAGLFTSKNAFRVMKVPRTATDAEIRKQYKVMAKELHPDKNPNDPSAEDRFMELKDAYDQLLNKEYREVYDKWGSDGIKWLEGNTDITINGATQMLFTYAVMGSITFLITIQAQHNNARSIALAALGLMLGVEGNMRFNTADIIVPFISWLTIHQMVSLAHHSYFTFVSGVVAFQGMTFVNQNLQTMELVKALIQQNQKIAQKLQMLDHELRITGKGGGLSKKGGVSAMPGVAGQASSSNEATQSLPRNLQAKVKSNPGPPPRKRAAIPSWLIMLGLYGLFNYMQS